MKHSVTLSVSVSLFFLVALRLAPADDASDLSDALTKGDLARASAAEERIIETSQQEDKKREAEMKPLLEQIRKTLNDPNATDKERAGVAHMELFFLEMDEERLKQKSKTLALAIECTQMKIGVALNAAPPVPAPSAGQPAPTPAAASTTSWHEVASFSGSSLKNTEPFSVGSDRWRVRWVNDEQAKVKQDMQGSGLPEPAVVLTVQAVSDSGETQTPVFTTAPGKDSSEMQGSGTWHFKVISANSDWTLVVEEFR